MRLTFAGGQDTVEAELKLVEASRQAGTIKRFFPAWWGGMDCTSMQSFCTWIQVLAPAVRAFTAA